jgi:S-adenosylmethionine:tRNA ribosyltransferase-isomerase
MPVSDRKFLYIWPLMHSITRFHSRNADFHASEKGIDHYRMEIPDIRIAEFDYSLPSEKIARFPLPERDSSKLLCLTGGVIHTERFRHISRFIPENSIMVFNNTRVIRARLLFQNASGTQVEIFCLEPLEPVSEIQSAFRQTGHVVWKCLVGNSKRWKSSPLVKVFHGEPTPLILTAIRKRRLENGTFGIGFSWNPPELTFGEFLEQAGRIPLPPYIRRNDVASDYDTYQTIYASRTGSVAAPTAGLHFTGKVMEALQKKHVIREEVTLHISLGTFKPVTSDRISDHLMHPEKIIVQGTTVRNLRNLSGRKIIAVGTTAVRTLESMYWAGVKKILNPGDPVHTIGQWEPYTLKFAGEISWEQSLEALLRHIDETGSDHFFCETRLIIIPGYRFHTISGMVTNFHQPRSTLLLLVAAFIGDEWKRVYDYALRNNYRFLSYGDACLFLNQNLLSL